MEHYNPKKHHRKSIRLAGYDYSQAGLYFVTICCADKMCRFGHVENGTMVLNEFGQIANDEWIKTAQIRPNVQLHEFVVMPNHIHGIIQLLDIGRGELHSPNNNESHSSNNNESHSSNNNESHSPNHNTLHLPNHNELHSPNNNLGVFKTPLRDNNLGVFKTPLRGPSQTIGAIVRGYKSSVTKQINLLCASDTPIKLWQRNYHDHIIRDEKAYINISNYIINNPRQWICDEYNLK